MIESFIDLDGNLATRELSIEIGSTIYGFCDGAFGRDSYGLKIVEAVGKDWIVVREDDSPNFCAFPSTSGMLRWFFAQPSTFEEHELMEK